MNSKLKWSTEKRTEIIVHEYANNEKENGVGSREWKKGPHIQNK